MNDIRLVNLIPMPIQRRQTLIHALRRWSAVVALLGVVGITHMATFYHREQSLERELNVVEQKVAPVLKLAQRCREEKATIQKTSQDIAKFTDLNWTPSSLHLLGVVATSAADRQSPIKIVSLNYQCDRQVVQRQRAKRNVRVAQAEFNGMVNTRLNVNGVAADDPAISRFLSQMRRSAMFEQLELKSARNLDRNGRVYREFVIEGQLILKGTK